MKPFIDFNRKKRKEATNEADKNSFKLLKNVVYQKKNGQYEKKNYNKDSKNSERLY